MGQLAVSIQASRYSMIWKKGGHVVKQSPMSGQSSRSLSAAAWDLIQMKSKKQQSSGNQALSQMPQMHLRKNA